MIESSLCAATIDGDRHPSGSPFPRPRSKPAEDPEQHRIARVDPDDRRPAELQNTIAAIMLLSEQAEPARREREREEDPHVARERVVQRHRAHEERDERHEGTLGEQRRISLQVDGAPATAVAMRRR